MGNVAQFSGRHPKVSSRTVSELNQKIYGKIEEWRMQPIVGEHPYVFVDGVYLKRSWGGEEQSVSVLVAIGVNEDGFREILGVMEGSRENKESWSNFLRYLKERGLAGVKLVVSDKCLGLYEIVCDFVTNSAEETLSYMDFSQEYRKARDASGAFGSVGFAPAPSKTTFGFVIRMESKNKQFLFL